ncbi:hypothetical protein [Candidatus Rhabdochlamydia sp. T3358]|uniref:hypothetical protein n=1 Tax=Candidatus Rhabdochlamydia sp. T3358 TaxID=2099795 RepID=UPI0010B43458|nr:hypothetical protein [Candidatus Rhabdochlamydia sp. T3358]VHO02097.1 hypothetical protein RHT_00414 [Candidatus Rhabdochlamydia sp. T3358]
MKIGPKGPSKPNGYHREVSSSLMRTRDKVRKLTQKIPHAFKAGTVHFSKLTAANKASKKISHLFTEKMNTFNR